MDDAPSHEASFLVVPLAFDEYREARHRTIAATAEARAVADLLAPLGGVHQVWDEGAGRDLGATDARLQHWGAELGGRSSMLLWFGHGESNRDSASLVVPGKKGMRKDAALLPEALAEHVISHVGERGHGAEWTFVLVEACGARTFVEHLEAKLLLAGARERLILVATGAARGRGYLSVFRAALGDVLATYSDNDDVINLRDFAGRLEERLAADEQGVVSAPGIVGVRGLVRASRLPEPIAAPLDVHAELRALIDALPDGERAPFERLRIGGALGELGRDFVDRRDECVGIADWLARTGAGMYVVTGGAGAGKSTVLGNVALHGHPEVGELLTRAGFPGMGWTRTHGTPGFDLFLPLTGASVDDVTAAIARAARRARARSAPRHRRASGPDGCSGGCASAPRRCGSWPTRSTRRPSRCARAAAAAARARSRTSGWRSAPGRPRWTARTARPTGAATCSPPSAPTARTPRPRRRCGSRATRTTWRSWSRAPSNRCAPSTPGTGSTKSWHASRPWSRTGGTSSCTRTSPSGRSSPTPACCVPSAGTNWGPCWATTRVPSAATTAGIRSATTRLPSTATTRNTCAAATTCGCSRRPSSG
ncbi:hypothetical protein [Actinomadura sp. CNU-125]|uniref:hypothetical protein n=1 Tax=Actinomadura sp. CNU-125 TaxID=1904961 RepID=UPI0021CCD773|nr:hypothetical protein [Actinomadura sp. CNU-125]